MSAFVVLAGVLGLTALFAFVNDRYIGLQQTIGLMLLAFCFTLILLLLTAIGLPDSLALLKAFVQKLSLDESLLNGVLCFMLFAGSINVKSRGLGEERAIILSLAIGSTLFAAILIGIGIWGAFSLFGVTIPLMFALIFGALISPTDPIAALAILGKVGLPPKLEAIINGEALFNDGVGVVLFSILLTVAVGTGSSSVGDALLLFLREVLGGVVLGLAASFLAHHLLLRTKDFGTQILISLAVVALAYGFAEHFEVSGPIAVVAIGLVVGNLTLQKMKQDLRPSFKTFWRAVDEVLNAMLFVLIGLHLAVVPFFTPGIPSALCAVVICLGARWLSVYLPLRGLAASGRLKANIVGITNLLTWAGLRGGLAIAMALSLPPGPEKLLILHMAYGVVVFSIVVQGLTVGRIFTSEKMKRLF